MVDGGAGAPKVRALDLVCLTEHLFVAAKFS
jgi:hypothetical protein